MFHFQENGPQTHLPYAKRRSLWWSPKVSHNRRDTLTSSTTSLERSRTFKTTNALDLWVTILIVRFFLSVVSGKIKVQTSWQTLYWSMAQTVGTCVARSWYCVRVALHARAQMSRVLPTALSPTTTHLMVSTLGLSYSMSVSVNWDLKAMDKDS